MCGDFEKSVDFDPGPKKAIFTSNGQNDIFILKLDSIGNYIWAKSFGSKYWRSDLPFSDRGNSIALDSFGNIYTTGIFTGICDFDPGINKVELTSKGEMDVFIQKLNSNGNFIWSKSFGGKGFDKASSICVDLSGNIYSSGYYDDTIQFLTADSMQTFTSHGLQDIFILKISPCSSDTIIDVVVSCDSFKWIDNITYTSSNDTSTYVLRNANGCDSIFRLNLKINKVSDITTSVSGSTITSNNARAQYQWLDCLNNFALIDGETNQSYLAKMDGSYAVELIENGCVDTSNCASLKIVGNFKSSDVQLAMVYPNPSEDQIIIQFPESLPYLELKLTNSLGRIDYMEKFESIEFVSVKLPSPKGIYILSIITPTGYSRVKVVKN